MIERDLATFVKSLKTATDEISQDYFQLPVAGAETPIYRERVYCYELYHHLRMALPAAFDYSLSGELDKSGHPIIRDPPLNRRKPDFLVHSPGDMERNLVAVEVKPAIVKLAPLAKDIQTVLACLEQANYEYGMLLIYGNAHQWQGCLRRVVSTNVHLQASLSQFKVYWHRTPRTPATEVRWSEILVAQKNRTQRSAPA